MFSLGTIGGGGEEEKDEERDAFSDFFSERAHQTRVDATKKITAKNGRSILSTEGSFSFGP